MAKQNRLVLCMNCNNWKTAPNVEQGKCTYNGIDNTTNYDTRCLLGIFEVVEQPEIETSNCKYDNVDKIPQDAESIEVFAIKPDVENLDHTEAYVGFRLSNGNFHYIKVPFTAPEESISLGKKAKIEYNVPNYLRNIIDDIENFIKNFNNSPLNDSIKGLLLAREIINKHTTL